MANLSIRIDEQVKTEADKLFNELGLNMSTAINMFLRQSIRENGIPFTVKIDRPNAETKRAIDEGRALATKGESYNTMDELEAALEL